VVNDNYKHALTTITLLQNGGMPEPGSHPVSTWQRAAKAKIGSVNTGGFEGVAHNPYRDSHPPAPH